MSSLVSRGQKKQTMTIKIMIFSSEFIFDLLRQKRVIPETSAPYTTYGDDHKHFNLELSKLQTTKQTTKTLLINK